MARGKRTPNLEGQTDFDFIRAKYGYEEYCHLGDDGMVFCTKSKSKRGHHYSTTVRKIDGKLAVVECNCPAFKYYLGKPEPERCWHVKTYPKALDELMPLKEDIDPIGINFSDTEWIYLPSKECECVEV